MFEIFVPVGMPLEDMEINEKAEIKKQKRKMTVFLCHQRAKLRRKQRKLDLINKLKEERLSNTLIFMNLNANIN